MGAERNLPAGSPHIVSAVPPATGPADGYMRVTRAVTSGSKYVKLDCGGSAAAARISEGTSAPAQAATIEACIVAAGPNGYGDVGPTAPT